jgi:hypothetical protein
MGLIERRATLAYKEKKFPAWKAEIDAVAGYPLQYEVDWEAMSLEGMSADYENMFDYGYFLPIKRALEEICVDDLGKEALKAQVTTLKLLHDPIGGYIQATLEGGTVVIVAKADHVQTENWVGQSVINLRTMLEKSL